MRTLIIPDIHTDYVAAEKIIERNKDCDKIIFLGDYFDQFYDNASINLGVANWLKYSIGNPNRIHLFGNHDTPYAFGFKLFLCSGNTEEKFRAINSVMTKTDWKQLRFYYVDQGWIFTHAGIHKNYLKCNKIVLNTLLNIDRFMARESRQFYSYLAKGFRHWFGNCGRARYGRDGIGGITWLDWNMEFQPVKGIRQCVGHTPMDEPQWVGENVCLDTKLRHYGILQGGEITVKLV